MYIKGINVSNDVLDTFFACDYKVCKGYCCHPEDAMGCVISEEEATVIESHKELIAEKVLPQDKDKVLKGVTSKQDSVYVINTIGKKCMLECGHCVLSDLKREGKLSYGMPIDCELYPLYYMEADNSLIIADFYDNGVCDCGYEKGERERIHIVEFCKNALIRKFGEEFYNELSRHIKK